jgi:U3 small nucleolar RNA-associated protein 6
MACPRPACRYIAYEQQLRELQEVRRTSRGISGKRGLAEWCIMRRIHFIYERATRKFK